MVDKALLSELQSFIGYETVFTDDQPIEEGMIKRFAEAIGDNNPLYHNSEFARKSPFGGIIAPPTFVFEWNHREALWVDETGGYIADTPLPKRLVRAGNEMEFIQPLRPGDIITTRSRITQVYEKKGSSGTMIFIICESAYTNQYDKLLATQRGICITFPDG